ncbi:aminotransferase class III-fold pyridoxal phosphate-dependent enzyme [Actinocrispum sp. NPDC049592]|uniref:aminotransferase class III-fold pyridoxal phosphate-dependent enzyme n=1 Tax=Actinocrispum sp. NPDC049592 TaxID=3154835 RepID=UPI003435FB61
MAQPLLAQHPIHPSTTDGTPLRLVRGDGARVFDEAGDDWIDFDNARGSVLLGHGHPSVAEAVGRAARGEYGTTTGWNPSIDSVLDRIQGLCGGQVMGLFRSGTAGVRAAVSAVRKATGKSIVLSSGYHGFDTMWDPADEIFTPNSGGIIDFYYDLPMLRRLLAEHGDSVAAVVVSVEPIYFGQDWFRRLREATAPSGVKVILDEVKSGLRHRPGLFVDDDVLRPDVWTVSKGLANGYPVCAVGGDPDLLAPLAEMTFTSFFEPSVLAAAEETLRLMGTGDIQRGIAENGGRFVEHARDVFTRNDIPIEVAGSGALFQFVCAGPDVEAEFYTATLEEHFVFFQSDHQAPSAGLSGDVLEDACDRFTRVGKKLAHRFTGVPITQKARYIGAWWEMCGLMDVPRSPEETAKWAQLLISEA